MTTYATNPQAIHETIDGETIIIDLATGTYYSLQGAATEIWNALALGCGTDAVALQLERAYDADSATLAAAVASFAAELVQYGLVVASSTDDTGAETVPFAAAGERRPFEPPRIERYDDMQDIILLDPVHQVDAQGWPAQARSDVA
jgi:hypothetical protein